MSVPAQNTAEDAPASPSGSTSIGASGLPQAVSSTPDADLPVVGACWRGKYDIVEKCESAAGVFVWAGRSKDGGREIILRAFRPTELEFRTQAWAKLGGIDSPHLQHAREALRAGDFRVEVADAPQGVPLHVWRAGRPNVDTDTVKAIVAQLTDGIGAMHAFELVHLSLKPEAVFVVEKGSTVHCTIAGLDAVTTFDRKTPVPAAVDPFYAPPEAHGLNVHVPGPGLCAWDWWSLGRITQEIMLGRHVAGLLTNSETHPPTPAARTKAEELLVEADSKGPRAGAVELMPSPADPQLVLLLRGLLTSPQESRWTGDNIDRWVRGQPVKEHYETRRPDTHFRWRGRPCAVPEIAALLQSAEHWPENSVQLFEPTTPGTLAHFLRWSVSQNQAHEALTSALELSEALPLKLATPAAQREAVTMLALLQLSAAKLVWRGRIFEYATVPAMMDELGAADSVMVLRALCTRSTALQIERIDAAAGRVLSELGRTAGDAESILRRNGWAAVTEMEVAARIFRLSAEAIPTLRAARDGLAEKFAGSDHPQMEKLFKAQTLGRAELVVLAFASTAPERYKFYTHAEAARRRSEIVRAQALEVTNALTWHQLERALNVGRAVFADWGSFIGIWFLVGIATMLVWPGPLGAALALVPAVVALCFRMLFAGRIQRALREFFPQARWNWRDGPGRCRQELRLAGQKSGPDAALAELDKLKAELQGLREVQPPPAALPALPRFRATRIAGVLSWVLVAAFAGACGWRAYVHPPSKKEIVEAWTPKPKTEAEKAAAARKAALEREQDTRVAWPHRPGENPLKTSVRATRHASSSQISEVTRNGRELVAPYKPETIGTLIVMPVTAGNGESAVMIFDGKQGELANEQVYVLDFKPVPRTWIEIAGRKGIYLDE